MANKHLPHNCINRHSAFSGDFRQLFPITNLQSSLLSDRWKCPLTWRSQTHRPNWNESHWPMTAKKEASLPHIRSNTRSKKADKMGNAQEKETSHTAPHAPAVTVSAIIETFKEKVIPQLRESVAAGNMPFGAAILRANDLSPVTVSVNRVKDVSPLLHGETHCIQEFFSAAEHPDPEKCIFVSTHEPCAMCLGAISWTKFPCVYFLFTYEETRDRLGMGRDREMLNEVFRVRAPGDTDESLQRRAPYNKTNKFWVARSVEDLLCDVKDEGERTRLSADVNRVKEAFRELESGGKEGA